MRTTKLLAVAMTAVLAVFALGACSSGSSATSSSASPTSVSAVSTSSPASAAAKEINIVESGFSQAGDYWTFAAVLENPNDSLVAQNISVDVTFKDDAGTVLYNTQQYVTYMFPLQKTAIAMDSIMINGAPTKIEVRATANKNGWTSSDGIQGGQVDKLFEITGLTEIDQGYGMLNYTGEVANGTTDMLNGVYIAVVFRNDGGQIVGGTFTYANNVPANGKAAFQAMAYEPPEHSTIEAYAAPSY